MYRDLADGLWYCKTSESEAQLIVQRIRIAPDELVGQSYIEAQCDNRIEYPYVAPVVLLCDKCQCTRPLETRSKFKR